MPNLFGEQERKGSQGRIPDKSRSGYTLYQKVNVSIDPDTFTRLEKFCSDEERARSWVIQKALDMYLQEKGY